jgi:hypothetical protein
MIPGVCLKWLRKHIKYLSHVRQSPGRNLKTGPTKYESELETTRLPYLLATIISSRICHRYAASDEQTKVKHINEFESSVNEFHVYTGLKNSKRTYLDNNFYLTGAQTPPFSWSKIFISNIISVIYSCAIWDSSGSTQVALRTLVDTNVYKTLLSSSSGPKNYNS